MLASRASPTFPFSLKRYGIWLKNNLRHDMNHTFITFCVLVNNTSIMIDPQSIKLLFGTHNQIF